MSVANFELLGGYRLDVDFAGEGLGLLTDANGDVNGAIAGAFERDGAVNLYRFATPAGSGADAVTYPLVSPSKTWTVSELFPKWMSDQTLRDVTVVPRQGGFTLAGMGRVFYNTSPRPFTQINLRDINISADTFSLGAASEIPVNLPEQEFSGFIKHTDSTRDLATIGAGAYGSGQGSVGGLSYAVKGGDGSWSRVLRPPSFGDLTSPRLPRDAEYSCPPVQEFTCIPPVDGKGVWSTERIGGGGVRIGNDVLFLPMLGYGSRSYARQTYTFGDPNQDRANAYFFRFDATGQLQFQKYERWPFAAPGEHVIGVALGRVQGVPDPVLFVVKGDGWSRGLYRSSSVVQLFRIKPSS
jgi:hypothetical protein